jgi:site-specific DNA-cytosine methylase
MTRFLDFLAGIGGIRLGLERAGWRCVGSVEKDRYCNKIYRANFPAENEFFWDDATTLRTEDLPDFDVLASGFPCFAAGTLVLTRSGYVPIETVNTRDLVLTHTGRWRKVRQTMSRVVEKSRCVSAGGCDIFTTDEHPFWVREKHWIWNASLRDEIRTFEHAKWRPASSILAKEDFVAHVLPDWRSGDARGPDFWWLVGRYLADGWRVRRKSRRTGGRVVISCGHEEASALKERVEAAKFHATVVVERTATKLHITNNDFYAFLEPFGMRAFGKRLPGFALELPPSETSALLSGYLSGDGYSVSDGGWSATTTSRALGLAICLLAQRALGVVARLNFCKMPAETEIEGRRVHQRDFWMIQIPRRNREPFIDGNYGWKPVTRNIQFGGGMPVYNLSIEEDESYMVENVLVHNCQSWSSAGKRLGFGDPRGLLFFEIARVLRDRRPKGFLLENVTGLLTEPFRPAYNLIVSTLTGLGYSVSIRVLNSRDFGVPQNRARVFFAGFLSGGWESEEFRWPSPNGKRAVLSDVLEEDPDPKYDLSPRMVKTILEHLARNRAKGNGWGSTLLGGGEESAPTTIPSIYYKGGGGAGRPLLVELPHGQTKGDPQGETASVRSNAGWQQVLVSFDLINMDQNGGVLRDPGLFQALTSRNTGKGVAVTTTNPHDKIETRGYHLNEEQRTLSAESSGTNAPLVRPALTGQLGTGGHNVPLIVRVSSTESDLARDRVRLVREDAPALKSGGWASYENALALGLRDKDRTTAGKNAPAVTHAGSRSQPAALDRLRLRRLTPRECLRLQGFPDDYKIEGVSDHRLYMQAGNSVTVPVIEAIGRAMGARLRKV